MRQITKFLERFIIGDYAATKQKTVKNNEGADVKALSFGTSDGGYTLRVGEVYVERVLAHKFIYDPKNPPKRVLLEPTTDHSGTWVIVPAKRDFFVKILESVKYPSDVTAEYQAKSGFPALVKTAAGDPCYSGFLTCHCYNQKGIPMKVYIGEGIVSQKLFEHENLDSIYNPSEVSKRLRVGN